MARVLANLACTSLVLATLPVSAASAAEPVVLKPASPWVLDYAEDKCRLVRKFGEGDQASVLFFEQDGPSSGFVLTLGGKAVTDPINLGRPVDVQFGPGEQTKEKAKYFSGELGSYGPAMIFSNAGIVGSVEFDEDTVIEPESSTISLPAIDEEKSAGIEWLSIRQGKREVRLDIGNMKAAFKALNACSRDMLNYWGIDADAHSQMTKRPFWQNPTEVIRRIKNNYPGNAVSSGEQGLFHMRVIVSATGKVTDCKIRNVTQVDSLKSPACRSMMSAEFSPALDRDGKPMASYYQTNIVYKIN